MRTFRTLALTLACINIACDSTSPIASGIGSEGGVVVSQNAAARVVIPAGALPAKRVVTVEPITTNVPSTSGLVSGAAYEFGPDGTVFNSPVTITIGYSAANVPPNVAESSLKLFTQVGTDWVAVPGSTVDLNAHTVTGVTNHFSRYAARGALAVSQVIVNPPTASITVGSSAQLSAVTQDANRVTLTDRSIVWTTADSTRARVSQTGMVTGVGVGTAVITATSEGRGATAIVQVTPVPVATITIAPVTESIVVGSSLSLTPVIRDASGNSLTDRVVTWATSDASRAIVSSAGVITGISAGTATITATSEGRTASVSVTVAQVFVATVTISPTTSSVAIGASAALIATTNDANGGALTDRVVTWTTSDPNVATVTTTGLVTGVAQGVATITASSEGVSATTRVTVVIPASSITITPSAPIVAVGAMLSLNGTPRDAFNNPVSGRPVFWSTLNSSIASVSPIGVVTGISPGTATIRASIDGVTGSVTVNVTSIAPIAFLTVSPVTTTVQVGTSATLAGIASDANHLPVFNPSITWTSSDVTTATVSSTGVVAGLIPGAVTITATANGISATSTVMVIARVYPVLFVTVSPTAIGLPVGATFSPVTATLTDDTFRVVTGRVVTWTSSNPRVATVTPNGAVTGVSIGVANIIATSEGRSGAAVVTVIPP